MKVDLALIRKLLHGSAETREENGRFLVSRFTQKEREVYRNDPSGTLRSYAASGIRLEFRTDARSFVLSGTAGPGSSRRSYYFDVAINGVLCHHAGFESFEENPDFRFEFPLDGSLNEVCVCFPCLTRIDLAALEFPGESSVEPVIRKRTILCYGDSITQGYDAKYSSLTYPNQLADGLCAEMFNKGIGGAKFNPALAAAGDRSVRPDLITVAYGTNDWSHCSRDEFVKNGTGFFRNLTEVYPGVPVLAVQPIWRILCETTRTQVGSFSEMYELIHEMTADLPQIKLVNGLELVPHLESCYARDVLHPNDFGFQFYGRNLLRRVPAGSADD